MCYEMRQAGRQVRWAGGRYAMPGEQHDMPTSIIDNIEVTGELNSSCS